MTKIHGLDQCAMIVQKYGGTSVGTIERLHHVAERIAQFYHSGYHRVAIVASAMAGETNRLLAMVRETNPETSNLVSDFAVASGEQVSCALLAAALEKISIPAKPMLGFQLGVRTDSLHAKARIRSINNQKIHQLWDKGIIPIITGFQGITDEDDITTLGRGGGDTSAVALAASLHADICEINTDVDGFYTADPRLVHQPYLMRTMDFDVALELAALGSKVLHSRCVELAAKFNVPLIVRNTFNPEHEVGTKIMKLSNDQVLEAPVVSGVTVDKNIARLTIDKIIGNPSACITEVFGALAKGGVNVDIIVHNQSTSQQNTRIGFTLNTGELKNALACIETLRSQSAFAQMQIETEDHLAKLSVVGLGMVSHPGVASRMFATLNRAEIAIHMISTSEIKISCVIDLQHADRAVGIIHEEFQSSLKG